MKRIMLYILVFLIYGIIVMQAEPTALRVVLFAAPVLACILLYKKFGFKRIFLLIGVSAFGAVIFCLNGINHTLKEAAENGGRVIVYASVREARKTSSGDEAYTIDADSFEINSDKINLKQRIIYYPEEDEDLNVCQRVKLDVRLYEISKNTNPYDFNAYNYYAARKIYLTAYGNAAEKGEIKHNLHFYLNRLKERFEKSYDEILPEKYSAIAKAIILGERWEIEGDLIDVYKVAGIYHILAISGLHISVICAFLVFIADKIHIRYAKLAVIAVLVFYAMMTGGSPSVVRAVIMAGVMLFRYIILRSSDFLTSAAFSCVIVLCISPMMLFDIGFQYSYCAVFAIGLILRNALSVLNRGKIFNYAASCIIIPAVLKVITTYYFYGTSNVDSFLNFIILPVVGISVVSAFAGGFVGMISVRAGEFCASLFYVIWVYINKVSEFLVKLPYAYVVTGRLSLVIIIGFAVFSALIAFGLYEGRAGLIKRRGFMLLGLVIFSISCMADMTGRYLDRLEIDFLDVGQGDSAFGKYKNFTFLIDGGGNILTEEGNDEGIKTLIPHIRGSGGNVINAAFVSHTDEDHVKGIIEIMGNVRIDAVYVSAANSEDENYKRLLEKAKENNIPVYKMKSGDYISYDKLKIKAVYPFDSTNKSGDNNNSSLVLRVEKGDRSFLFTGDIEKEAENAILNSSEDIKCDIIKIAHHGSNTSSQLEFLEKTGAKAAIISAGRNNIYGHPSQDTVERIEESKMKLYTTAENGAVCVETDGKTIDIKTTVKDIRTPLYAAHS